MHGVDHDRLARGLRDCDEGICDFALGPAESRPVVAVTAEVAGDEHGVDLARGQHRLQHPGEGPRVLLAGPGQVDRVAGGTWRAGGTSQLGGELGGEQRHCQPGLLCDVGRQGAVTAAVREHAHSQCRRHGRGRAQPDAGKRLDELRRGVDPLDAGCPGGGVDRQPARDEGARVGAGGSGAGPAGAGGEEHDRLAGARGGGSRLEKPPAVDEVLAIDGDRCHVRRPGKGGDEIGHVHVGLIAERGEADEAEPGTGCFQSQLEGEVAALGDQPDLSGRQLVRGEQELCGGVAQAEAVRAEQDGAGGTHLGGDGGLDPPAGRPGLAEAGGDADDRLCPAVERLPHRVLEGRRRHAYDRQLDASGDVSHRDVYRLTEDCAAPPVDQLHPAPVGAAERPLRQPVPPLRVVCGGPDDGDGGGAEERSQVAPERAGRSTARRGGHKGTFSQIGERRLRGLRVDLPAEPVTVEDRIGRDPRRDAVTDAVEADDAGTGEGGRVAGKLPVQPVVGPALGDEHDAWRRQLERVAELVGARDARDGASCT